MGKALYREYRPLSFDDVKGQEHITDTLKNALKKGAISHAYLFTGPKGVGKTSIARILAHAVNELPYDEKETHLDIIEIDAASNRRIDEIRELRDKVHVAPTSAKYKVYIIDEVHMLTREAFNALLKTLEEPPEHAIFILATTEAHKVPDTIQSRTQRYTFRSIEPASAATHLRKIADKEKLVISDEALALIAEHGKGSFRDSISMLDQLSGFKNDEITAESVAVLLGVPSTELLAELLQSVSSNDVELLFNSLQRLREQGMNPSSVAQSLLSLLRRQLLSKETAIDPESTIALMKSLLPLTGLYGSHEGLEIALLDAIQFSDDNLTGAQSKTDIQDKPEIKAKIQESTKPVATTTKAVEPMTDAPPKLSKNEDAPSEILVKKPTTEAKKMTGSGSWNDILVLLKKEHNTLYGVLRMAEVENRDNTLVLTFQFEFHKKRLSDQKNMHALQTIVKETLGQDYTVEVLVKKNSKKASMPRTPTRKIQADDDSVSSVSNIFGGAELLES